MRTPAKGAPAARLALVALVVLVVALMMPRFNQRDWGIAAFTGTGSTNLGDAEHYVEVAKYFAGEPSEQLALRAPFSDRPFVPAVASVLPGSHLTGINLLGAIALVIACLATYLTALRLSLGQRDALAAAAMLGISFPVLYYGTIGYLDPVVVGVLAVGLLATVSEQWWLVLFLTILGVLVKESAGVVGFVAAAYVLSNRHSMPKGRAYIWAGGLIGAIAVTYLISRSIVPSGQSTSWRPSVEKLIDNLKRPRSTFTVAATCGVPAAIVAARGARAGRRSLLPRPAAAAVWCGVAFGVAQGLVGSVTAYLDGRLVWGAQPFLVVAAAAVLKLHREETNEVVTGSRSPSGSGLQDPISHLA